MMFNVFYDCPSSKFQWLKAIQMWLAALFVRRPTGALSNENIWQEYVPSEEPKGNCVSFRIPAFLSWGALIFNPDNVNTQGQPKKDRNSGVCKIPFVVWGIMFSVCSGIRMGLHVYYLLCLESNSGAICMLG